MSKFPNLFTPIQVGTHTYKNRIIASPIYCGTFINIPGLDFILDHAMCARAEGGCAQVTIGETPVDFAGASREPFPPIDYSNFNDPTMAKMKSLVSRIKAAGAKCLIELSHCGESVEKIPGVEFGLGPMGYTRPDGMEIIAMDEQKMQEVTNHFITASKFMKEAGTDGVMIHAGHGWLLHQFLSSRTNHRTDEYGGSLENRARFPLALIKAVREEMGKDFIIEIRVSGEECMENGMGITETVDFCKMAEPYVDLIHMSIGVYRNPILSGEFSSLFHKHGLNAELSAELKKAVKVPVVVVGGINSPELAEELIAEGKCDFVALGRQVTADPDFAKKALEGKESDINPCLRCFKCFPGPLEGVEISEMPNIFGCTVNPTEFFYDLDFLNKQPEGSRNVLVVGGGVAGMQAAITAYDRGHKVTLIEKEDKLGGLLFFTDHDYYKTDLRDFKDLLIRRVTERNINVVYNKVFSPEDIAAYDADAIILAVGSSPITPPIKGIETAMKALEAYRNISKVGKKVVMVGGGLVGCETALNLAKEGREVIILEMGGKVSPDSYPMHRVGLLHEMEELVSVLTNTRCTEISPNQVKAVDENGKELLLEADTVIYALGMAANAAEAQALEAASKDVSVYKIGDCVKASKVYDAIRQAFVAAMSIY
ncbi:MAG: NADH-flavin oxidoreductase, Old yellow enzyme family [Herbinix sp.]|nr:NADH-flavin oxidoreductase, Old yellow enzyme family [Herbinix sp.]